MNPRLIFVLATAAACCGQSLTSVQGQRVDPLKAIGNAAVAFFISTDCPISNSYAPEIQKICAGYGNKGVRCVLVYEDVELKQKAALQHLEEYRYRDIPAVIDADRKVAWRAKATVTPQAVITDASGQIRYRGRIDDFVADFGKTRRQVTEHDVRDALDAILAGKPVARPQTKAFGCTIVDPEILKEK